MKLLFVGGTSFVGRHAVDPLGHGIGSGREVAATTRHAHRGGRGRDRGTQLGDQAGDGDCHWGTFRGRGG